MMPASQSASAGSVPPRLHRPFRFYDPEVVAVLVILLGLFQLLLGMPAYYLSVDLHSLYMCPVFVGAVHVTGGSFAFFCERSPSKQSLKNCLYFALIGLLVGLCAIVVYAYAVNSILSIGPCDQVNTNFDGHDCIQEDFIGFFRAFAVILSLYDIVALVLQCFVSFSAIKGLKTN